MIRKASLLTALLLAALPLVCSAAPPQPPYDEGVSPHGVWVRTEYLNWDVKKAPVPVPFVTSGAITELGDSGRAGVLGRPGTQVLLGNQDVDIDRLSGARLTLGWDIAESPEYGFEVNYMFLGEQSNSQSVAGSGAPGSTPLGIPFFNTLTGREDATGLASPEPNPGDGAFAGTAVLSLSTRMDSLEFYGVRRQHDWEDYGIELVGGFRHISIKEDLTFDTDSPGVPPSIADVFQTTDSFQTHNDFNGLSAGIRARYKKGKVRYGGGFKLGVGNMRSATTIGGSLTSNDFSGDGSVQTIGGGYFALLSNIGRTSVNHLAVVPEINGELDYKIHDDLSVNLGYSFLYATGVMRPGEQVDRQINISQSQAYNLAGQVNPVGFQSPVPLSRITDWFAHGFNVGVSYRF
jgi:hypothetical protein